MEVEDASPSQVATQACNSGPSVEGTDQSPVVTLPSSTSVDSQAASTGPSEAEDRSVAAVQSQSSSQTLAVEAAASEAVLSAQSQQSIDADASEVLAPSQSMALLHTQSQATTVEASQADVQLVEPISPAQQLSQPAEAEIADLVEASLTDTTAMKHIYVAASGTPPAQDAASASGELQEEGAAPFAHATFVVPTENWKHLQMVPLVTTAAEIKHSLCSNWNIAESALSVKYNKQEIQDAQSLASCGIQARLNIWPRAHAWLFPFCSVVPGYCCC